MSILLDINLPLGYTVTMMNETNTYKPTDEELAAARMLCNSMKMMASRKNRMADSDYEDTVDALKATLGRMMTAIHARGAK